MVLADGERAQGLLRLVEVLAMVRAVVEKALAKAAMVAGGEVRDAAVALPVEAKEAARIMMKAMAMVGARDVRDVPQKALP